MTKDMTAGSPARLILMFSLPLLLGNLFQQFYTIVDAMIVGRMLGVDALAAVGSTGPMSFLALGFIMGITGGSSVVIAQRFGAGDRDGVRRAVAMSIYAGAAVTVFLTAVCMLAAGPILRLMNAPQEVFGTAYRYIQIIYAGVAATCFYNLLASILRALGDSRTPLYFLIVSSVLNIILDVVFIEFGWGVEGTALATVLSQAVSGLLCLVYMAKKFPFLKLQKGDWSLEWGILRSTFKIGIPMALQFWIITVGIMILQGAVNVFGAKTIAAYAAASKVEQFACQPMVTLGMTMATYTGQNIGAGRLDRVRSGMRKSILLSVVFCVASGVLVILFGGFLVGLFLKEYDAEVIAIGRQYLNTLSVFFCALGLLYLYRNALQGLGEGLMPMLAGLSETVVRIFMAFVVAKQLGFLAVCLASPVSWIVSTIPLAAAYYYFVKKTARLEKAKAVLEQEDACGN